MAKPPPRKPKKKVCQFCKEKIAYVDYKDTGAAAEVHLRPRQDPRPPGHRQLHPAPARRRHGRQEQPRDGAAALHQHCALRGATTMKLILTQEVAGLGGPGDIVEVKDGYGRNYLSRAAPRSAGPAAARSRSPRSSGPARSARSATSARPARSRASSRASPIKLPVRAGDGGRLFGAVTVADIVDAVTQGRRPGRRQAPDRDRPADQDRRRAPGHGPGAPRGHRDAVRRGRPPEADHDPRPYVRRARSARLGAPAVDRSAPAGRALHVGHRPRTSVTPDARCGSLLGLCGWLSSPAMTWTAPAVDRPTAPTSPRSGEPPRTCSTTTGRPCCGSAPASPASSWPPGRCRRRRCRCSGWSGTWPTSSGSGSGAGSPASRSSRLYWSDASPDGDFDDLDPAEAEADFATYARRGRGRPRGAGRRTTSTTRSSPGTATAPRRPSTSGPSCCT